MNLFSMLSFLGGVALFLFGMRIMGDAIRRQAGGKFKEVLQRLTSNPWKGLLLGTGVTALIQSSSAACVIVLGFLNSGLMTLQSSLSLIYGANIGTCATAWLLALKALTGDGNIWLQLINPDNFVPVLALVGAILQMFSKSERKKDYGLVMLGFAVLMYGMDIMSASLKPLTSSEGFRGLVTIFSNPVLGVLVGFVLAAVTQSSSASVGILQAVAAAADIRFKVAYPMILGINVGAMIIVIISSVGGNKDARRAALIAFVYNLLGAVLFLPLWLLGERFGISLAEMSMNYVNIAVTHTLYKTLLACVFLPFSKQFCALAEKWVRPDENENRFQLLDERFIQTPSVAVGFCSELARDMAMLSLDAVHQAVALTGAYEPAKVRNIGKIEEQCDLYEDKLGSFVVKLTHLQLTVEDGQEASKILHCLSDMERISDHAVSIASAMEEMHDKDQTFSPVAMEELGHITGAVSEIIDTTMRVFRENDAQLAASVEPLEEVVDELIDYVKKQHIMRLQQGECTILKGFIFSDILNALRRISDHCSNIAACVLELTHNSLDTHEYLHAQKTGSPRFAEEYQKYLSRYGFNAQKS